MKSPFLWLALIGALLAGVAAYFQATSMDLSRFSLSGYLLSDSTIPAWWHVVAIPFMLGLFYLITAWICLRLRPPPRAAFGVFVGCLLLAAGLCFFNVGVGLLTSVMLVPLLVAGFPRAALRQNSSDHGAA